MLGGRGARGKGGAKGAAGRDAPRGPGGAAQRAAHAAAANQQVRTGCSLVRLLLQFWAWGHMSPQTMQKIALAAKEDIENTKRKIMEDGPLELRYNHESRTTAPLPPSIVNNKLYDGKVGLGRVGNAEVGYR